MSVDEKGGRGSLPKGKSGQLRQNPGEVEPGVSQGARPRACFILPSDFVYKDKFETKLKILR